LSFLDQVKAVKIVNVQLRSSATIPLEVQAFRSMTSWRLSACRAKSLSSWGWRSSAGSPFVQTLVIELCNDNPAYIPTKKAFAEGSYETVNSIIQPGGASCWWTRRCGC